MPDANGSETELEARLKSENDGLRREVRELTEKSGVLSIWLVQEGDKVKALELQIETLILNRDQLLAALKKSEARVTDADRLNRAFYDLLLKRRAMEPKHSREDHECDECMVLANMDGFLPKDDLKRNRVCGFWTAGVPCPEQEPCPKHGTMPTNRI